MFAPDKIGTELLENVPLLEFMYLVFTRIPGDVLTLFAPGKIGIEVLEDVPLLEFMYPVFTRIPGDVLTLLLVRLEPKS